MRRRLWFSMHPISKNTKANRTNSSNVFRDNFAYKRCNLWMLLHSKRFPEAFQDKSSGPWVKVLYFIGQRSSEEEAFVENAPSISNKHKYKNDIYDVSIVSYNPMICKTFSRQITVGLWESKHCTTSFLSSTVVRTQRDYCALTRLDEKILQEKKIFRESHRQRFENRKENTKPQLAE